MGKPPIRKYKAGNIVLSVWENDGVHGKFKSYTLDRIYKDGNEFKTTNSFHDSDFQRVLAVLRIAEADAVKVEVT